MKHVEVQTGAARESQTVQQVIESILLRHGLRLTLKGTLGKYPGCVHWHFKKHRHSGTIELTMWPQERRVWISVQAGRRADWIKRELPEIIDMLQRALA